MAKKNKKRLKKRTWHYLYEPSHYEVHCNEGGTINDKHKVAWSEYEGMIWCYDCKKDMRGFGGIFDGPIPLGVTELILGKYCFHRYDMVKKVIREPVTVGSKIVYRIDRELTKKMLKGDGNG